MTREVTNKLLEMCESGDISWEKVARAFFAVTSEDDIADMVSTEELIPEDDGRETEDNFDSTDFDEDEDDFDDSDLEDYDDDSSWLDEEDDE